MFIASGGTIEGLTTTHCGRGVVSDRSVYVVPGSSRRRSTSVDAKLTMDGLIQIAALPVMQGPAGGSLLLEAARRWFDDQGLSGLDWDAIDEEQKLMAVLAQQQAAMGGGAPPEEVGGESGPPGSDKRPSEMTEPSLAGQTQGVANIGGGRLATGASAGDQQRMMRGKAGAA